MKVWLFVKQDAIKEQTYLKYLSGEYLLKEEIGKAKVSLLGSLTTNMLLALSQRNNF
ncbi:MAG: hypothetical protein V8R01_07790 [Bacilli bacterium]